MSWLIQLIIVLIVVGALMYILRELPWIDDLFKRIIYVIVTVIVLIWLLKSLSGHLPALF